MTIYIKLSNIKPVYKQWLYKYTVYNIVEKNMKYKCNTGHSGEQNMTILLILIVFCE